MAVIYNTQYVDEKYSDIIEPNLYLDSVLQPGVTFTDKYTEQAGGIFVHKLGGGLATAVEPGTPGRDFTDEVVADSLIQLVFNNNFQKSRKIYGVTSENVAYNKAEEELAEAIKQVSQGWQQSGVASLVHEGTDFGDITAITGTNFKEYVIKIRKAAKDLGANIESMLLSTDVFEAYLTYTGQDYTPSMNDSVLRGRSVEFLGIRLIEANILNVSAAKYYDYTGTLQTKDLTTVDMVGIQADGFSAINNFEMMRLVDSERFSGSLAQVEMNAAYRVTNADKVIVKFNA